MISVEHIHHSFKVGKKGRENEIKVLKDVSLTVEKGEIACIVGRSGSGKSTLLNLISGYIAPTEGKIVIDGTDVTNYGEKEWAAFRLEHFGFIFQSFQLIPSLTTFENIELPLTLKGVHPSERKQRVNEMLHRVGLENHAGHYPNELSGGQQQRVSIARALILNPSIILADEPTGSLDSETEQEILEFIRQLNRERGITFVIITHDDEVASIAKTKFQLSDGVLEKGEETVEV
ncbi:ABC transporter ATP-binding protein [Bacillus haynesii]|uniref:ABC transporter ATP-binding protein n=1 Tax=Bacillus haynesii TaxID=1925021 RepID=UPI0015931124|nr:ABC transporter ATP-binding protein [Bacillus haynesii]NVB33015.1 ABC transporter ATP-binding protein [Bacillus licheniformis]MCY7778679.1 ABC transporter ATP-binding protein [Bacillus haynesii]MCY7817514.1 ABC transporter ATP-binding protein [Bacillus haynesii]MCY8224179.1 ABC transporter ATP-binding protein [Bacillus haynesii]MCY8241872.1 ABC transporter ATP-binding protein [Bacillus haynesii]